MATIRDVAERSGVSTATVSYVLNNREGEVSPETRERVLAAMRALDYRPRAVSSGKKAAQTNTLGVLFPNNNHSLVTHPYFTLLLDGILQHAQGRHGHVTLFTLTGWTDLRQSLRVSFDGRCDALIVIAPDAEATLLEVLTERSLPFVLVNAGNPPGVAAIDVDNEAAGFEATQQLLSLGHTRIAYLGEATKNVNSESRRTGWARALTSAGIVPDPTLSPDGYLTVDSGRERALALLELPDSLRPTAIFGGNDWVALGALQAAKALGRRVPEDLALIGFDDLPHAALADPPLATIRQPLQAMGEAAARLAFSLAQGDAPEALLLPTELVARPSLGLPVKGHETR
jgi:DNA-binding LacI/PurR family transcriptional regulator